MRQGAAASLTCCTAFKFRQWIEHHTPGRSHREEQQGIDVTSCLQPESVSLDSGQLALSLAWLAMSVQKFCNMLALRSLRWHCGKQPKLCMAVWGHVPRPVTVPLPVCSLILDCAGMGWDLEALPAQETCEPAKYGGGSCRCNLAELLSVLRHISCRLDVACTQPAIMSGHICMFAPALCSASVSSALKWLNAGLSSVCLRAEYFYDTGDSCRPLINAYLRHLCSSACSPPACAVTCCVAWGSLCHTRPANIVTGLHPAAIPVAKLMSCDALRMGRCRMSRQCAR